MASKIIFLGTAGDGIVTGKQHRASGGIVLDVDGNLYHLNPGPGTLVRAQQFGVNLRQNIAVLAASQKLTDANDVNAVIEAMTYTGMDKCGVLIAHPQVIENLLTETQKNQISRIINAQPDKKLAIENVDIFVTKTTSEQDVGFKLYTPDFVFGYMGNTEYSEEVADQFKDADILVLNVPNPGEIKTKNELCIQDSISISNRLKPKLVILTYFGAKMLKADPLYEAREVQRQTQIQVISAKDGFILSPLNYNSQAKQKTLFDVERVNTEKPELKDSDSDELY